MSLAQVETVAGVFALLVAGAVILLLVIVDNLIIICPPNRVAVISGRTRVLEDGRTVGYRLLEGVGWFCRPGGSVGSGACGYSWVIGCFVVGAC